MLQARVFMLARRSCITINNLHSCHPHSLPWPNPSLRRRFTILAIETSCDDTAVAILRIRQKTDKEISHTELLFNRRITSNNVAYQGIHPLVALESHRKNLSTLIEDALHYLPRSPQIANSLEDQLHLQNGSSVRRPNVVAVTRGPGMRSSLMAGLDTAKGLAVAWQVPLVGVHHMQAHALTPRLSSALSLFADWNREYASSGEKTPEPAFPFLTLLVSGGHTLLLHSTGVANHHILADTADIAIGDCLDKCARSILPQKVLDSAGDVAYGRLLESFAFPTSDENAFNDTLIRRERSGTTSNTVTNPYGWRLPVPLFATRGGQKRKSMQFSFSGLATYAIKIAKLGWVDGKFGTQPRACPMPVEEARFLAREVMRVAFEHLASRVSLQLQREHKAQDIMPTMPISKSLVISGGVAANRYLLHIFQSEPSLKQLDIVTPAAHLCTDNAAMIAWTAYEMLPILFPSFGNRKMTFREQLPRGDELKMDVLRKWSLENILDPEKESTPQDAIGDAATAMAVEPHTDTTTAASSPEDPSITVNTSPVNGTTMGETRVRKIYPKESLQSSDDVMDWLSKHVHNQHTQRAASVSIRSRKNSGARLLIRRVRSLDNGEDFLV